MKQHTIFFLLILVTGTVAFLFGVYMGGVDADIVRSEIQEKRTQRVLSRPENRRKLLELVRDEEIIGMRVSDIKTQFGQPEYESSDLLQFDIDTEYFLLFGPNKITVELSYLGNRVTEASAADQ